MGKLANRYDEQQDKFYEAVKANNAKMVWILLTDARVDPSLCGNWAIRYASEIGNVEVVRLLLLHPLVDPSADDNYAIRYASEKGHVEVVKLLLGHSRVNPSAKDNYAIQWSSYFGHDEVVKLLLEDGRVDPSANDNRSEKLARGNFFRGVAHQKVVELLVEYKKKKYDPEVEKVTYSKDEYTLEDVDGKWILVKKVEKISYTKEFRATGEDMLSKLEEEIKNLKLRESSRYTINFKINEQ